MDPCIIDDSVEIPTRCSFVIDFIIPKFLEGSTFFEQLSGKKFFPTQPWQRPVTTWVYKPEAANTV
jgi:hypothetical protein